MIIQKLTNNDYDDNVFLSSIRNENIFWEDDDGHDTEIYFYDGNNIVQLSDNNFDDKITGVPIYSDTNDIIWTAEVSDDHGTYSAIYLYDGEKTIQITDNIWIYSRSLCYRKSSHYLVSYNRFIELKSSVLVPLIFYLNTRKGQCTGISFIDTMGLPICHNKRAKRNKVFENLAHWGKSSLDWYFGFKLHLIINELGEILAFKITEGNIDYRKTVPYLTKDF